MILTLIHWRKKRNEILTLIHWRKKRNEILTLIHWRKKRNEILTLIHWRKKRNEILTLIHWSSAIEKQQTHRTPLATIDRFARRMRDLHRDEDFNNALNRVRNTSLKFRARITAHRHWRFHDLTSEKSYYKKMIFASSFRSKYAENKAIDRVYAEKKLAEIENVLRCEKCRKRRIWMMYE